MLVALESFNGKIHCLIYTTIISFSQSSRYNLISFVPQNFAIINSSILDNIVFFDKHFRNDILMTLFVCLVFQVYKQETFILE